MKISETVQNKIIEDCMRGVDEDKRIFYRAALYDVIRSMGKIMKGYELVDQNTPAPDAVKELVEALKPFADIARNFAESIHDAEWLGVDERVFLQAGAYRNALKVLAKHSKPGER